MYRVKWVAGEVDGRVGLVCPYNDSFRVELCALVPGARFDRRGGAWCFDEEQRHLVMPLIERYFTNTAWQRVTLDLRHAESVSVDGASLISATRDNWWWRRDAVVHFRIVECAVSAGGSRRCPTVSGQLVLDIDMRIGADVSPLPADVVTLGEQDPVNPLANYATGDLLAELARRGVAP